MIRLEKLCKSFSNGTQILENINLEFPERSFTSLVGPSGCGKTTLLRIIAGLEPLSSGHCHLEDTHRSYVFQDSTLLPWRTVLDNIRLPMELHASESTPSLKELLKKVHLEHVEDFYPHQLSGGMKMRVSIARALATKPKILLMDEPFGALDDITRQQLNHELLETCQKENITVLFVTHNLSEAVFLSQRILLLSKAPGRIISDIPIDLPSSRDLSLKTSPDFNRELEKVHQAFYSQPLKS